MCEDCCLYLERSRLAVVAEIIRYSACRGCHRALQPGSRGHPPRPRPGLAARTAWPHKPGPAQGHVGHRAVPQRGAGRTRAALRGLRTRRHRLQLLPKPALPKVLGQRCSPLARSPPERVAAGRVLPRGFHPAGTGRRARLVQLGAHLPPAIQDGGADAVPIRSTWVPASAPRWCCTHGGRH